MAKSGIMYIIKRVRRGVRYGHIVDVEVIFIKIVSL